LASSSCRLPETRLVQRACRDDSWSPASSCILVASATSQVCMIWGTTYLLGLAFSVDLVCRRPYTLCTRLQPCNLLLNEVVAHSPCVCAVL
jgi:hypothetical protein